MPRQGGCGRRRDQFFISGSPPPSLLWPQPLLASGTANVSSGLVTGRDKPVGLGKGGRLGFCFLWDLSALLPFQGHIKITYLERAEGLGVFMSLHAQPVSLPWESRWTKANSPSRALSFVGGELCPGHLTGRAGSLGGVACNAGFHFFPQVKGSLGLQRPAEPGETQGPRSLPGAVVSTQSPWRLWVLSILSCKTRESNTSILQV